MATLALSGELDLSTANVLEGHLREVEAEGTELIILDLRSLTFLDSTGLASTLQAHKRAKALGRRFMAVPGPPNVQKVFEITGLDGQIEFLSAEQLEQLVEPREIA